jgi:IMP dehydrogenase
MKTVGEVIHRAPVWVNPDHTAESAIVLMRGHDIGALPVLDGPRLVGMVLYSHLLGIDPRRRVGDVMLSDIPALAPEMSIRDAADAMSRASLSRLPVVHQGKLVGVVTDGDLLPELGRSVDPLTDLPWPDSLREWAIDRFRSGREITVLFFDIDGFGQFNKLYGHIIGDEVLQAVARTLAEGVEEATDFLCRYGGDEFCIATLRPAEMAGEFAARLAQHISQIDISSLSGTKITCAVGQFGGKRTREREHVHYAATLNSLINLASRDCTARKMQKPELQIPAEAVVSALSVEHPSRLRLERVEVKRKGKVTTVDVDLQLGPRHNGESHGQGVLVLEGLTRYKATCSEETDEAGLDGLVARTTVTALHGLLPQGYDIVVTDTLHNQTTGGETLITVVGQFIGPAETRPIAGSAMVSKDRHHSTASAVLAAVNRPLGLILAGTCR